MSDSIPPPPIAPEAGRHRLRRSLGLTVLVLSASGLTWFVFFGVPKRFRSVPPPAAAVQPAAPVALRKIKARLFYLSEDGSRLVAVERDVPFGDGTAEQARQLVQAQVAAPTPPLASAIPAGTTLRALFMGEHGEAYVDLSATAASAHSGGSLSEILTVYALVDALTVNLPAITTVQLLVDGHEVDTLAGHLDLRRPLQKDLSWVETK